MWVFKFLLFFRRWRRDEGFVIILVQQLHNILHNCDQNGFPRYCEEVKVPKANGKFPVFDSDHFTSALNLSLWISPVESFQHSRLETAQSVERLTTGGTTGTPSNCIKPPSKTRQLDSGLLPPLNEGRHRCQGRFRSVRLYRFGASDRFSRLGSRNERAARWGERTCIYNK